MRHIILFLLVILFLGGCKKEDSPTQPSTPTHTIKIMINGKGEVVKTPLKDEYIDGESVTIKAIPDSGWLFQGWEGSILTNDNPFLLTMKNSLTIIANFKVMPKKYEPDITGDWYATSYSIILNIYQKDVYDSTIKGTMKAIFDSGDTLTYSVTGTNLPPNVKMTWKKSGYYPIDFEGQWTINDRIHGVIDENNKKWGIIFVRTSGITNKGIPSFVKKFK